jgi:hypothetical protein
LPAVTVPPSRCDLVGDDPALDSGCITLLALERVRVLRLASDPVALGDDLGGDPHREVEAREALLGRLVHEPIPVLGAVLHHRDRLDASSDRDLGLALQDHVGGLHDRLGARRAEAIHGRAGDGERQPRRHRGDPGHIHAHAALGMATAEGDVLDLFRVEIRLLGHDLADRVGRVVDGLRHVEGAAVGLGQASAETADDYCFSSHAILSLRGIPGAAERPTL